MSLNILLQNVLQQVDNYLEKNWETINYFSKSFYLNDMSLTNKNRRKGKYIGIQTKTQHDIVREQRGQVQERNEWVKVFVLIRGRYIH